MMQMAEEKLLKSLNKELFNKLIGVGNVFVFLQIVSANISDF